MSFRSCQFNWEDKNVHRHLVWILGRHLEHTKHDYFPYKPMQFLCPFPFCWYGGNFITNNLEFHCPSWCNSKVGDEGWSIHLSPVQWGVLWGCHRLHWLVLYSCDSPPFFISFLWVPLSVETKSLSAWCPTGLWGFQWDFSGPHGLGHSPWASAREAEQVTGRDCVPYTCACVCLHMCVYVGVDWGGSFWDPFRTLLSFLCFS